MTTDQRSGLCHGPACQAEITDGSVSEDFCGDDCQTAWNAANADPPMPLVEVDLPGPSMARWTPEGGAPVTPETSTWEPTRVSWVPTIADPEHPTTAELMGGVRLDGLLVEGAPIELESPSPYDPPTEWAWTDVTQHVADAQPGETVELGLPRRPSVTPTLPSSIQEGDQLVVLMDNRTGTFTPAPPKMTVRLAETGEVLFDGPVEPWPDPGPTRAEIEATALGVDAARSLGLHYWNAAEVIDPEDLACVICGFPYLGGPIPPRCTPPTVPDQRSWFSRLWRWMWLRG